MPLNLPKLDDRNFADLVDEARNLIQNVAPEWTNYNPSDPGITLIELFAFLTEIMIYRLDRVTDNNTQSFLRLMNGPDWQPSDRGIQEDVRTTIQLVRKRERAVSCQDFERLTKEADTRVARSKCIPRRNFDLSLETESPGHVSLIVVPKAENMGSISDIIASVESNLEPRRLVTTHLHVAAPVYLPIELVTEVVPLPDVPDDPSGEFRKSIAKTFRDFLDPLNGGGEGDGWPFGRNVFVSEVFELLDLLDGVDYVNSVNLNTAAAGRLIHKGTELVGIDVRPYELVQVNSITVNGEVQS